MQYILSDNECFSLIIDHLLNNKLHWYVCRCVIYHIHRKSLKVNILNFEHSSIVCHNYFFNLK